MPDSTSAFFYENRNFKKSNLKILNIWCFLPIEIRAFFAHQHVFSFHCKNWSLWKKNQTNSYATSLVKSFALNCYNPLYHFCSYNSESQKVEEIFATIIYATDLPIRQLLNTRKWARDVQLKLHTPYNQLDHILRLDESKIFSSERSVALKYSCTAGRFTIRWLSAYWIAWWGISSTSTYGASCSQMFLPLFAIQTCRNLPPTLLKNFCSNCAHQSL